MLDTIKHLIQEQLDSDKTFQQFYAEYVAEMQDKSIALELRSLSRSNITPQMLDEMIADTYKGMMGNNEQS